MDRAGGKIAAVFERAFVGREFDRRAATRERRRQRGGGKQMAARAARRDEDAARLAHAAPADWRAISTSGRLRVSAMRKPMPRPSASKRRSAVGDERQRHALGGDGAQIDGHVDPALHAEHQRQPRSGEAAERILVAQGEPQAAHDDEAEEGDQREAGDHAEFLAGDGEDEVGVRVGQNALVDALARPAPEPAARENALQRGVDLERVDHAAGGIGIDETQHALVHVRRKLERREARRSRRRRRGRAPRTSAGPP